MRRVGADFRHGRPIEIRRRADFCRVGADFANVAHPKPPGAVDLRHGGLDTPRVGLVMARHDRDTRPIGAPIAYLAGAILRRVLDAARVGAEFTLHHGDPTGSPRERYGRLTQTSPFPP